MITVQTRRWEPPTDVGAWRPAWAGSTLHRRCLTAEYRMMPSLDNLASASNALMLISQQRMSVKRIFRCMHAWKAGHESQMQLLDCARGGLAHSLFPAALLTAPSW